MYNIKNITRKNILQLKAYSSARDEFKGKAEIWLDANENPNQTELNRYPDPLQWNLRKEIARIKAIDTNQIFIGNGSDEAIDLLFRAFCEPGLSKAIIFPPTYGMYEVSAAINNIDVLELPLDSNFELPDFEKIKDKLTSTGLLFICSPNNPTGNSTDINRIKEIANRFYGLVVVDEAYIDFSEKESALSLINDIPNLVVLQTFSKAYGLAGARVGMGFANPEVISVLNKIKPPYNVSSLNQEAALAALAAQDYFQEYKLQIENIIKEKEKLKTGLSKLNNVINIFPSDANFLLVQFTNSDLVFNTLLKSGIVVRNRTSQVENCLRISIGTEQENEKLLNSLNNIES